MKFPIRRNDHHDRQGDRQAALPPVATQEAGQPMNKRPDEDAGLPGRRRFLPGGLPSFPAVPERTRTVLSVVAVILTLFLLAAALDNLEFKPGESFVLPQSPETASGTLLMEFPVSLFDAFLVLLGIGLVVSLILLSRSPKDRRVVLRWVSQLLLVAAIGLLASRLYEPEEELEKQATPEARAPDLVSGPSSGVDSAGTPVPVTLAPAVVPGWVRYVITLAVVGLAGAFGYWIWWLFHPPKEQLHEIARLALGELFAGRNWEDVVIQCYADMSTAISRQRGVGRHQAMTPREFAARLEQIGLPASPVSKLTRLFEQARYGSYLSTPEQVCEATDCLADIMRAVGREGH
jgi:Domain of unknown function (DUF4129)